MKLLTDTWHEVRQSVRCLAREPRFATTVIAILALCLAANVAIFTAVRSVLLKPLPFRAPKRLVTVHNTYPKVGIEQGGISWPHYLERRAGVASFADAAAMRFSGAAVGDAGIPERVDLAAVTPSFFPVLGVGAKLGRTFTDAEGVPGGNPVVVLSDGFWRQRFGGDPNLVGQTIRVDSTNCTVIGVMPRGFRYLARQPALWIPLRPSEADRLPQSRHSNDLEVIARLRSGVGFAAAQAELDALNQRTLAEDPLGKLAADAGLLGLSFSRVLAVRPGLRADHVLTGAVGLPASTYPELAQRVAFVERLTAGLRGIPGVAAASVSTSVPFGRNVDGNHVTIADKPFVSGESLPVHYLTGVAGDYFSTMGIPLREGRYLTLEDSRSDRRVCVVDEVFATHYWPEGGAIGHGVAVGPPNTTAVYSTIVGVVGTVKQRELTEKRPKGALYLPYRNFGAASLMMAIRTEQTPEAAGAALRAAALRIDPELPLYDLKTMTVRLDESLSGRRLPLLLAGTLASVAVVLAALGIYGALAYTVGERRREIGVRMALGAAPGRILRQFLGYGVRLLALALPLGWTGSWFAGQAMGRLLFDVVPGDPLVLGVTAAMLAAVALLACLVPSRTAARIPPIEALRG